MQVGIWSVWAGECCDVPAKTPAGFVRNADGKGSFKQSWNVGRGRLVRSRIKGDSYAKMLFSFQYGVTVGMRQKLGSGWTL